MRSIRFCSKKGDEMSAVAKSMKTSILAESETGKLFIKAGSASFRPFKGMLCCSRNGSIFVSVDAVTIFDYSVFYVRVAMI